VSLVNVSEPCRVPLTLLQAMQRGVDLIAIVPIQPATSRLEIRHVLAALSSRCGRSLVVSTEGADSSPLWTGGAFLRRVRSGD
jgi:hypothetical protein